MSRRRPASIHGAHARFSNQASTPTRFASANSSTAEQGIQAVPSVIVNDKYLIQGGQPVEVFEQALRNIAAESRS